MHALLKRNSVLAAFFCGALSASLLLYACDPPVITGERAQWVQLNVQQLRARIRELADTEDNVEFAGQYLRLLSDLGYGALLFKGGKHDLHQASDGQGLNGLLKVQDSSAIIVTSSTCRLDFGNRDFVAVVRGGHVMDISDLVKDGVIVIRRGGRLGVLRAGDVTFAWGEVPSRDAVPSPRE